MKSRKWSSLFIIVLLVVSLSSSLAGFIPEIQANPDGMDQVLFGGFPDVLPTVDTEYATLVGGFSWFIAESARLRPVSTDGVIKNLRIVLSGAPGAGKDYNFTVMLNGALTPLSVLIADGATSGSNMVDAIVVTGGDTVSLQCNPDGTPTARTAIWTSVFRSDRDYESLIVGGSYDNLNIGATEYGPLMSSHIIHQAVENNVRQVIPTNGTLKNFYVVLNRDPGFAPDAYRFTVRLNGASPGGGLVVTIVANDVTGSDLVNSIDVVAGDVVTMMIEPINSPITVTAQWGMMFEADINGESIILGGSNNDLSSTLTEYHGLMPPYPNYPWQANEATYPALGQNCTLKKLYFLLSVAPGAGNKYEFTVRVNGTDSNLVTTVSGADTTGNSGGLETSIFDDDYANLKVIPDSLPTVADAYWGLVCYISPAPPITPPSDPDLLFGAGFNASSPYVELHWNHSLVDVQFFEVQNSSDKISWAYLGQSNTANYTDNQVINGTERYYRVRACNQTGGGWFNSSWTDVNFETVYFIPDTGAQPQVNIPQIDAIAFNTTIAGRVCGVNGEFSDVEGLSGYIFWNNATVQPGGTNSSFTALAGVSDSALENITLPSSGDKIGVRYYVNDTSNNWAIGTLVIFPSVLNQTQYVDVNITGAWVVYNVSQIVNITGIHDGGNTASVHDIDGDTWNCSEVAGAPGYLLSFNFTGVNTDAGCLWLSMYVYYDGNQAHDIDVELWNFTSTSWIDLGHIDDDVGFEWHNVSIYDLRIPNDFINSTGAVLGRLNHVAAGNPNHDIYIEYLKLQAFIPFEEEAPPGVGVAVDDYSIIFLAMGLIFCLAIYFLYARNK